MKKINPIVDQLNADLDKLNEQWEIEADNGLNDIKLGAIEKQIDLVKYKLYCERRIEYGESGRNI